MFIQKFFWFCAGADSSILSSGKCATERNKYAAIGATVLLTALLASISASYALYTVFQSYHSSIPFGILWGIVIFNLDRYFVLSIKKERGGFFRALLTAVPRLILAVLISVVITAPLELKIFEREIADQMASVVMHESTSDKELIEAKYAPDIAQVEKDNKRLRQEVSDKEAEVNELYRAFIGEAEGTSGTLRVGKGPVYGEKKEQFDQANTELSSLRVSNNRKIEQNDASIRDIESRRDKEIEDKLATKQQATGFIARLGALHELGKAKNTAYVAFVLIGLVFVAFETSPIIVKLLSKRGPYDAILERRETEVIHLEDGNTANAEGRADREVANKNRIIEATHEFRYRAHEQMLGDLPSGPDFHEAQREIEAEMVRRFRKSMLGFMDDIFPVEERPSHEVRRAARGARADFDREFAQARRQSNGHKAKAEKARSSINDTLNQFSDEIGE